MAVSMNTINIIKFLQGHKDENLTAVQIADAMGLSKQTVNGAFTSGVCRKGYGVRVEDEVFNDDTQKHEVVKYLKLTDAGLALDADSLNEPADAE